MENNFEYSALVFSVGALCFFGFLFFVGYLFRPKPAGGPISNLFNAFTGRDGSIKEKIGDCLALALGIFMVRVFWVYNSTIVNVVVPVVMIWFFKQSFEKFKNNTFTKGTDYHMERNGEGYGFLALGIWCFAYTLYVSITWLCFQ